MKKGLLRRISLLMAVIMVCSSLALLCSCSSAKTPNQYVDEKMESTLEEEAFDALADEEKVEAVESALKEMETEGHLKEGTIQYDEDNELFTFEYSNGALGGVSLEEFKEGYNTGSAPSANTDAEVSAQGGNTAAAGQSESVDDDNKAIILNAFENTSYRRDYYVDLEKDWDADGLATDVDVDVTLDDLKKLSGYDVVVFAMHGGTYLGSPVLCINQEVTARTDEQYATELAYHMVAKVLTVYNGYEYWVLPEFFTYQYSEENLESDVIFSESCCFFGEDIGTDTEIDYSFSDAISMVSDSSIIGYHNSVYADYSRDVMKYTIDAAMEGKTFGASLNAATEEYGEDDGNNPAAYPVFIEGNNRRLIDLPVTDFTVPDELVVTLGELGVIEPEINPADASGYTVKWTSSDETVATVAPTGEAGIITTLSKGTTTITATLTSCGKTFTKTTKVKVASKARDTVLVLDISGSMYGTPMTEMKESAIQFCNDLLKDEYNNRVGLVFYETEVTTIGLTNDLDYLIEVIEGIDALGLTNMEGGVAAAKSMLKKNSKADTIKNVVIMADGLPNEGKTSTSGSLPQGSYSSYTDSVMCANAVIDTVKSMPDDYNIYSLGFFHGLSGVELDFGVALMKELVDSDENYYQVDKAENLQFAFGDIQEEISVGSKIVINIACPVDVKVSYGGEMLSSDPDSYCDATSFGTLQLVGKNKDIKVLSLDSDKEYQIEVIGTGTGKMDYSVSYFDEKEQLADYRSFEAIPITPTTIIKSDTDNVTKDITLDIDHDGDGVIDTIWTALKKGKGTITFEKNPITLPAVTEPETEKADFTIIVICVLAMMLLGGIVLVVILVVSNRGVTGQYEEDEAAPPVKVGNVPCVRCGKLHPADKPCECQLKPVPDFEAVEPENGVVEVTSGSMSGFAVPVKSGETIYLGKDKRYANLVFTNDYRYVGRLHCSVTYDANANRYYVTDSSTNGTYFVNKQRLEKGKRTPVRANSVLLLANEECTILLK